MGLFYYSYFYQNFHNQERESLVDLCDGSSSELEDKAFLDKAFAGWEVDVDDAVVDKLMSLVK
ncbi:MAG: hypothetical protein LBK47_00985 [Prevotellaceae bacterium]|nr:hypothetical protein [Prevotellaceae bacterium]